MHSTAWPPVVILIGGERILLVLHVEYVDVDDEEGCYRSRRTKSFNVSTIIVGYGM